MIAEEKTSMRQKLKLAAHRCRSLLSRIFKYLVCSAAVLAAIMLFIFAASQFYFFPHINAYKDRIEAAASATVGVPVKIASIQAHWRGVHPEVVLNHVVIQGETNQTLHLPQVKASLAWRSLFLWQVRFAHLVLDKPDLMIHRLPDGSMVIGGIPVPASEGDSAALPWLLSQHHIQINHGTLHWQDDLRQAPELTLHEVNIDLSARLGQHRLQLQMTPEMPQASAIKIDTHFTPSWHTLLNKNAAYHDLTQWSGDMNIDIGQTDLSLWKPYIDYPFALSQGAGAIKATLHIRQAKVTDFSAELNVKEVRLQWNSQLAPLDLKVFRGKVSASETYSGYFKNSF